MNSWNLDRMTEEHIRHLRDQVTSEASAPKGRKSGASRGGKPSHYFQRRLGQMLVRVGTRLEGHPVRRDLRPGAA
ncbi:MAG: hypothetical protein ACRDV4_04010 [Acidimicrobiales bacterium]